MNRPPVLERRRIVVVAPHLDDAPLSLGATIARCVRLGSEVTAITVFAGDPESKKPAGRWDAVCGFDSEGHAAVERRHEDGRACEILGARPIWLPFSDEQYADGRTREQVVDALLPLLSGADTVLIPGHPLAQADHLWLTEALIALAPEQPYGLYVEQPYASDVAVGRSRSLRPPLAAARIAVATRLGRRARQDLTPRAQLDNALLWSGVRPTRAERVLKYEAIHAYESQCTALGRQLEWRIRLSELVEGGERVALSSETGSTAPLPSPAR